MAQLRHLVVVIPGIGGSVLSRGNEVVWGRGLGDVMALLHDPGRLDLATHDELKPCGVIRSTSPLPGWTVVHGSNRLLRQIANAFPDERNRRECLLVFDYDFRRSVRDAAGELDRRVEEALRTRVPDARGKRVVLVAHSMGGLVARYWLALCGGWRDCLALITLGTPHRGAPKALDWLVNGVRVGPRPVDSPARWALNRFSRVNQMLQGWPSRTSCCRVIRPF